MSISTDRRGRWKALTQSLGPNHGLHGPDGPALAVCLVVFSFFGLAVAMVRPGLHASQTIGAATDCPADKTKINLVFIIDRSGSLANEIKAPNDNTSSHGRGQTYNVEIEGVRRALLDPSVIPRDGSVSVGVVLFDGAASVAFSLTPLINSDSEAQAIAAQIETLRCPRLDSHIEPCPAGETIFGKAISEGDRIASLRSSARRVLIMSTDGEAHDEPDAAHRAVASFRESAAREGIEAEFDIILMGLRQDELVEIKPLVDDLVFPSPPKDLPGAVEVIDKSACNEPNAVPDELFEEKCGCQVRQFADFARRALRSQVSLLNLTVATLDDPDPSTPVPAGGPLSLRQAIEMANSNGGRTTITFDSSLKGTTIQPRIALPALTAPDITICGCIGGCTAAIPDHPTCSQALQSPESECLRMVTIDGQMQLADGILIRSNRDAVRGLKIINFTRTGIVVQPCDNAGSNVGNTISMNDISGSVTAIDLGGDGPTANDVCDTDEGPNTLINFPRITAVTRSAGGVTVAGTICDPSCTSEICPSPEMIGAIVEIFAITGFENRSAGELAERATALQAQSDNRIITGVMFLAQGTTDASGFFSISSVPDSPTGSYTATVTDGNGNTSEFLIPCSGLASPGTPDKVVFGKAELNGRPVPSTFTIRNDGCDPLVLMSYSIKRTGGNISRKKNRDDDSAHFSIDMPSDKAGAPLIRFVPVIPIDPGQRRNITVLFNPAIPRCVRLGERLRAADTLPDTIRSVLTIFHSGGASDIQLEASVPRELQLISANCEQPITPPLVTLTRSGDDELTVTYSVFDSNMNVNNADYVFFKKDGNNGCSTERLTEPDEVLIVDRDLSGPIQKRGLVGGQSFTVLQRFSNANQHPEVGCVQIKVTDGEATVSAMSGPVDSSLTARSLQTARRRGPILVLPSVRALPKARIPVGDRSR